MNTQWLMIKQLDQQLKQWQAVGNAYLRPRLGWVKTVREALYLSADQLARRLGLKRSRIIQLEKAEIHDAITLRTLRKVANAMDCELIYAIVPKNQSTLENIIKTRAEKIATQRVARVAHTMALEGQSVSAERLSEQKDEILKDIIEHLNKKFWKALDATENFHLKKAAKNPHSLKKLIKNLKKKQK